MTPPRRPASRNGNGKHPRTSKPDRTHRTPVPPAKPDALITQTDAAKVRALAKFREAGIVAEACRAAGIARRTWYDWIQSDPAFGEQVAAANEDVVDELEGEAIKRAKDGDTGLLMFILKCRRSAVYQDRQTIRVLSDDSARQFLRIFEGWLTQNLAPDLRDRAMLEIRQALIEAKL